MKTKLPIVAVVAILVSACATGTYTTKNYDDGIYFTPANQPPVTYSSGETAPAREKSANVGAPGANDQGLVMRQMSKNPDGSSSLNNYIYQPDKNHQNSDIHAYNMDNQELAQSDTTELYNDDSIKYVINNYYDDNDDIDYAYRIGRFYRPFYSPFFYDNWNFGYYSPWYSGYYGWNWGIGWDPWYYGGWGYPYYYGGYYSPYYLGFSGYWGLGYPYWNGYYGGYWDGYYGGWGGHYADTHQVARRRATNMNMAGGGSNVGGLSVFGRSAELKNQTNDQNKISNTWVENGHVRSRSIDGSTNYTKSATIVNDRRAGVRDRNVGENQENQVTRTPQVIRQETNTSGNVRRSYAPSTTSRTYNQARTAGESQNYTPSYNKPRIVNQSSYNNNSYSRPRTYSNPNQTIRSSNAGQTQIYNAPRSSSSVRQTYRSGSSYYSGSSSSSYRNSSTQGATYSAPARSSSNYSGGSYNSGSFNSGGNSSGGHSGGSSGGSGHRR